MKKSKKALVLLTAFVGVLVIPLVNPPRALAASVDDSDFKNATYRITSLDNNRPKSITANIAGVSYTFTDSNTGDSNINLKTAGNTGFICSQRTDTSGITLKEPPSPTLSGTGKSYSGQITLSYSGDTNDKCREGSAQEFLPTTAITAIYDPTNPIPGSPPPPPPSSTTSSGGSCESSSNIGLEWAICPILGYIDGAIQTFYGFVQDQLCFPTGSSSTAGAVNCGGNNLTPEVHQAWSLVKNLATAALVIIMLVMVISQAVSWGPFDAYTVRKVLPKLVAAAILMQLSWVMAKWFVDLSNDLGEGVSSLMYPPFPDKVNDINQALRNLGSGGTLAAGGLFTGLVAAGIFSGLTIGGVLIMGLTGLAAVFIGFLVLFFRKILIIFSVIFIPLALAAWILPGTERFWKLWRETFTKLLLMFPLIMAIIAAGHIFAFVAGGTSHNVAALFAVLIGFFGPLFVLPKTYQWGGVALSNLSGAMINGTRGIRRKPMGYSLDRAKENKQIRGLERAARLADDKSRYRRWDQLMAGRYNIARGSNFWGKGDARMRQFRTTIAQGREESEKAAAQQLVGSKFEQLAHNDPSAAWDKLRVADVIAQGGDIPELGLSGKNPALQRHMLNQLAEWSDWDRITRMRSNKQIPESVWQQFVAKNISLIHQQAPHLSPLGSKADLSQAGYEDMAGYKDEAFEELKRQYFDDKKRSTNPTEGALGTLVDVTDPAELQERRARFVANARAALEDSQVRRRINAKNLKDLEEIAYSDIDTPTVDMAPTRGGKWIVSALPKGRRVVSDPQARTSLTSALIHPDAARATPVRAELARQLASGTLDPADQGAYEAYLGQLKIQAGTSPQAKDAYNDTVKYWHDHLDRRVQQAEQAALAAGKLPADIAVDVNNAQTAVNTEKARMAAARLTPI